MLELIGKTISCILCRGSILYFDETGFQKFCRHLQFEHSAMHDFDFMLAACKMTDSEKGALVSVFNKKGPDQSELQTASSTAASNDKSDSKTQEVKEKSKRHKMFRNQSKKSNRQQDRRTTKKGSKRVGNNIIDVKTSSLKAKKLKTRPKLMTHKTKNHSSLSRRPKVAPKKKSKECLKTQMYIGATTAGKAAAAVVNVSQVPEPVQPPKAASESSKTPSAPVTASTAPDTSPTSPKSAPIPVMPEIKIECEDTIEIVDIVPAKDKSPASEKNLNGTGPNSDASEAATISAVENQHSSPPTSPPEPVNRIPKPIIHTESPSVPVDQDESGEPPCLDCLDLANSASKLSRHKRYVHGSGGSGFKADSEKPKKESLREMKKSPIAKKKIDLNPEPTPFVAVETVPPGPGTEKESIETVLKPCLKKSTSVPRRLSVSFNETISFSDNMEEIEKNKEVKENQFDESAATEESPKRSRGRPKKIETEESSKVLIETEKLDEPEPKKMRLENESNIENLDPVSRFPPKPTNNNNETSASKKELNNAKKVASTKSTIEAELTAVIQKNSKPSDLSNSKESDPQNPKSVSQPPLSKPVPSNPVASDAVPNIFILRQCENCSEMFANPEHLKNHGCPAANIKTAHNLAEVKQKEKNNIVANVLIEDLQKKDDTPVTLDEEAVVIVDTEAGFVMKEKDVQPNVIAPKFVMDKTPVVVQEATVKMPYDSFLETVLVEDKSTLMSTIDRFRAELTGTEGTNNDVNVNKDTVVICDENYDNLADLEKLQFKYRRLQKCVDFTKSPFFMKNAELIGGKGTGSGFKEVVHYLPDGWRVKTFNEYKKFYFTPECIVLKSCTAVMEYLRLKYDLAQEDLKTLAEYLGVNSNVFNRYLDELFDDCVVLE